MSKKMLIIGLTGPSGAGKGAVGAQLVRRGIPHIDTDAVYHDIITPPSACLCELAVEFGEDIIAPDGSLDRKALAAKVFGDGKEAEHSRLNFITHKYVLDKVRGLCAEFAAEGKVAVAVDAPLLFESGFDRECDKVISVLADKEIRIARIMARDSISREYAESRVNAQKPDDFYSSAADAVIYNNGDVSLLCSEVSRILADWQVMST
ncbi:MAG: dephospho-CoA kinase [Ruminococcaceae bacterium]|nr:dephospho-CoA kinase [Oscillospiraceae bacterium]